MNRFNVLIFVSLCFVTVGNASPDEDLDRPFGLPGTLFTETKSIVIKDGRTVDVEAGTFLVAEDRQHGASPVIELPFYRLKSTADKPAAPVFLLAGGPGSSWIDRFENIENFKEVQLYQEVSDVIIFDQRGAGHARPKLVCNQRHSLPLDEQLDISDISIKLVEMSGECRKKLQDSGVNLSKYNTVENLLDVLELRSALGYKKISLVGGSYGSHLALALMRAAPESVESAILYGIEGPDHTWDIPSLRFDTYHRIAQHLVEKGITRQIKTRGIIDMLEASVNRLDTQPVMMEVKRGTQEYKVLVDGNSLRLLAGFQAGRKSKITVWPEFISDIYNGNYELLAQGALAVRQLRLKKPMAYMMDCASGVTADRMKRISNDPATEILGDINFEYRDICKAWEAADLGDDFRDNVTSAIRTLIVHGTWDTSTPIENAREVVSNLSNGHLIEVETGNHGALYNLYESWEPMQDKVKRFLRGNSVSFPESIKLPSLVPEPDQNVRSTQKQL